MIFVADRENGRIQCFSIQNGSFIFQIAPAAFGGRLFSVAYSNNDGTNYYLIQYFTSSIRIQ